MCRRAERRVIPLVHKGDADAVVLRYINRLSDYLFTAARLASLRTGHEDAVYKKARVRKEKQ